MPCVSNVLQFQYIAPDSSLLQVSGSELIHVWYEEC